MNHESRDKRTDSSDHVMFRRITSARVTEHVYVSSRCNAVEKRRRGAPVGEDGSVPGRGGRVHRAALADEAAGRPLLRQGAVGTGEVLTRRRGLDLGPVVSDSYRGAARRGKLAAVNNNNKLD